MSSDTINSLLAGHADSLYDAGKFDEAMRVAATALRNARRIVESDPQEAPTLIRALQRLAGLHQEIGDFDKAESMYLEALELAVKDNLIPRDQLAHLRSSVATLYDFNQQEAKAIPYYEQAIVDYTSMEHSRDLEASQLRNNLAMIYKSLGMHSLAEQHYLVALETTEQVLGRNNERVAAIYNNLGSLYHVTGHPEQSKEMHLEALMIRSQVFGETHPEVAQSYNNLATSCYELQDDAAALQHYERSLAILEQNFRVIGTQVYEEVAEDYVALLEALGEDRKAQSFRKRMVKLLNK